MQEVNIMVSESKSIANQLSVIALGVNYNRKLENWKTITNIHINLFNPFIDRKTFSYYRFTNLLLSLVDSWPLVSLDDVIHASSYPNGPTYHFSVQGVKQADR